MPDETPKDAAAESTPDAGAAAKPTPKPAPAAKQPPPPAPDPEPKDDVEPDVELEPQGPSSVTAHIWALGDHSKQVPLSGLLIDDPSLRDELLLPEEWQKRLGEYLQSERV